MPRGEEAATSRRSCVVRAGLFVCGIWTGLRGVWICLFPSFFFGGVCVGSGIIMVGCFLQRDVGDMCRIVIALEVDATIDTT